MDVTTLTELSNDAESLLHTVEETEEQYLEEIKESLAAESASVTEDSTSEMMDQIEAEHIDFSNLTGIQKSRAVKQKLENQSMQGMTLEQSLPQIAERAIFRTIFQVLFQAQRLQDHLNQSNVMKALDLVMINDLVETLDVALESTRLAVGQKDVLKNFQDQVTTLKIESENKNYETWPGKVSEFENNLNDVIQKLDQMIEPYINLLQ